ncbi:M20 family metallopeptidase [Ammoniphilus sp. YIM 78166]|uniref:M20 family metallopeptidase n=1 Tax=Ammoniphilus sp. YIM 78166 TaxID=1644106 RepID=UPI00106FEE22|nr:M20/M25/M40 family metallo-hydrolase [Ammoniphilus sp. YIM 78166]
MLLKKEQILSKINDQELIQLLQTMIQHKSYSGNEGELSQYLADYMRKMGLEVELQEVEPGRFNVIGFLKGTGGGESVMYNGHIDTNPVGLGWTVDPLGGVVDDECIYGIGVSNMKASDAAFIAAVRGVIESGIQLKGDVTVGLVIGELQGGIGTLHLLDSGIRSDWFINGEPTDLSLMTLHAGAFEITIHVYGVSRHLSKAEEGVNAIEKGTKVIEALRKMRFSGASKPEYAGLNRYNIGVIRGGLGEEYHEWRVPQLPDLCSIKVALRYAPSQTPEGMIADVQRMLDQLAAEDPEFKAEIEVVKTNMPHMGPFEVDRDEPVVETLKLAHIAVTGEEPRIGDVAPYKYYGTDAAHLQRAGIKGIIYGCGGKYNTMPDERVELKDLKVAARVYALSLFELCNREKE